VRTLEASDLRALAAGATLLGTGGGGDPYIGFLMAAAAIERHGPIRLVDVDELPPEGLVVQSAMMGAPTVIVEKVPNGGEMRHAMRLLERRFGQTTAAVLSAEAGGMNSLIPVALAAETGLPLVNADGMGRAFPELQMSAFHVHGLSATPMVVVDDKGNAVTLETIDNRWTERLARTATVQMGGSAIISLYPLTTAQTRAAAVRGTIALAIELGEILLDPAGDRDERLARLTVRTGGREIFRGKVQDVLRRSTDGFARGTATLVGLEGYRDAILRIEFQNENLLAQRDGEPVAMVPDLISVLDQETLRPITTEALTYGQRAIVLATPCDPVWRTAKGLETVGPRAFGYDFDYRPIEGVPS
jgi:DUF917 family protein